MIKYPVLNDLHFTIRRRGDESHLEWNSRSLSITNLLSFKNTSKEQDLAVTLTFPYGEVILPCANSEILTRALDKLENFLKLTNQVPELIKSNDVEKIKENLIVTPNQVLKTTSKQEIPLLGLKDVGLAGKALTLYYEQSPHKPLSWNAPSAEEAQAIFDKINSHLSKMQILKIFKTLQNHNPIATPQELWEKATETHTLIKELNLTAFY